MLAPGRSSCQEWGLRTAATDAPRRCPCWPPCALPTAVPSAVQACPLSERCMCCRRGCPSTVCCWSVLRHLRPCERVDLWSQLPQLMLTPSYLPWAGCMHCRAINNVTAAWCSCARHQVSRTEAEGTGRKLEHALRTIQFLRVGARHKAISPARPEWGARYQSSNSRWLQGRQLFMATSLIRPCERACHHQRRPACLAGSRGGAAARPAGWRRWQLRWRWMVCPRRCCRRCPAGG